MKKLTSIILIGLVIINLASCSSTKQKESKLTMVKIETSMGDMVVKLYNETPQHRDNFIKLVNDKYYDGILFHRVIKDFMIQAGDPESKGAEAGVQLGNGGPGYTIPAEFNTALIHKKGALSAARQGDQTNPKKASSGSQFYIVQGKIVPDAQMDQMEESATGNKRNALIREYVYLPENKEIIDMLDSLRHVGANERFNSEVEAIAEIVDEKYADQLSLKYTEEQREAYKTLGGTPFLDREYTVFGEIVEGLDILDKIAAVKTQPGDRPVEDVTIITMTIVK